MFARISFQTVGRMACRLVVLIATMLVTSTCQPATPTFRPPNQNELQAFVKDQSITPLVDKLLDDSLVLLYENGTSFGYYVLTVNEPGDVLVASSNVSMAKSNQPILLIGQLTGVRPFMAVVIQDTTLSTKTTAIEVAIDSTSRLTSTTDGKRGVVLVSPSPIKDWETVTLYSAQGHILYSQRGNPLQQLRVLNSGSEDIQNLTILFPGPTSDAEATRVEFGDVSAGKLTDYRNVASGVYRYSAFSYTLEGRVIKQFVVDWVGESPMRGTKFTYRLALNSQKVPGDQMQIVEVLVDEP